MDESPKATNGDNAANITLTAKQWKAIVSGIVGGIILVGSLGSSGILRVDKYTASDHKIFEHRMREWTLLQLDKRENAIRNDMPPETTKMRIRSLERCMEKQCTDFEANLIGWQ